MFRPFFHGAHHAARAFGFNYRVFQVLGVPFGHRLSHRVPVFRHAQYTESGGAVVGEVTVKIAPAAVFSGIDAHHGVALGGHAGAVHLHVLAAA